MRYEILYRYGGVYCDVDLECLKSIVTLLPKTETDPVMILCNENDDRSVTYCSNSWIAVTSSHHPALEKIMDRLSSAEYQSRILHSNCGANETTGPHLLGWGISEELKNITILPRIYFYPFLWYNKDAKDRNGPFPDSYAIHHWAESWKN